MTQNLWIFNKRNHWWTNGKYTITESVLEYGYERIQSLYYKDTGYVLCKDDLRYPAIPRNPDNDWKPFTPRELLELFGI